MCSCQGAERESQQFPVAMAKGFHLFPYRTQKLRPSAPMVLGWTRPGRVGRRRIPRALHKECSFFVVQDERKLRMRSILMRSTHFWSFEANRRCGGRCCDDSVLRKYAPDAFHANMLRMNCTLINVLLIIPFTVIASQMATFSIIVFRSTAVSSLVHFACATSAVVALFRSISPSYSNTYASLRYPSVAPVSCAVNPHAVARHARPSFRA